MGGSNPPIFMGTDQMTIQRISSGGEFEKKIGYCRAVVAGGFVLIS